MLCEHFDLFTAAPKNERVATFQPGNTQPESRIVHEQLVDSLLGRMVAGLLANEHALGIATDLFTPIFAVSRIAGWTAHVLEQYANNRLIRPRAEYIGPEYPQRYVPLEGR